MKKETLRDIFTESFRSGVGHSRMTCECGQEFYNSKGGWDWEDGELKELRANGAIDLEWTVPSLVFEGKEYCTDCLCWHERAHQISQFLIAHNSKIVEFYKNYKAFKQKEVDSIDVVDDKDHEED